METLQGKAEIVIMLTMFIVTILLSQFMGQVACLSIMLLFVQTLDEDSNLSPSRMLFAVCTLNTIWTSKIPVAMGDTEEWSDFSSNVQSCIDMFGPADLGANMDMEQKKFADPKFRWHKLEDTHGGALIGGDPATIRERADAASVTTHVNAGMTPLMILHGGNDPIVPKEVSSDLLYQKIVDAGLEDRCEYHVIPHAGHGTREFFQDKTKELMIGFFDKTLKK